MHISGLQKLSLLDYPGKIACTIFLNGCNFKCHFCHNKDLVLQDSLSKPFEWIELTQFIDFIKTRQNKLDAVCISGGEPLLHNDILDLIEKIKSLGFLVKLDTNGYLVEKLKQVVNTGLIDYVAMDIKTSKDKYAEITNYNNFDVNKIMESVSFLKTGIVAYEFRTTLIKEFHTEKEIVELSNWIQGDSKWFFQKFVDSGNTITKNLHALEDEEMKRFVSMAKEFVPNVQIRGM